MPPQKRQRHSIIPASYLILMDDDHVLLLRRFQTGYEDGNYSFIAGHVDSGETFTKTMVREAREEAGVIVLPEHLEVAHIMHRKNIDRQEERVDVFMIAKTWEGEIRNMEPNKCDDLRWFPIDHLPANTIPYVARALDDIRRGRFYSEYGW